MRRKLIAGWILLIAGFLLLEASYMVDVWLVGVLGRSLWPIGAIIVLKASRVLERNKQEKDSDKGGNLSETGNE